MSQHGALRTGNDDLEGGQQSLSGINEISTLQFFKQIILFIVKPRLDSKNTIAKNKAVIALIVFINAPRGVSIFF